MLSTFVNMIFDIKHLCDCYDANKTLLTALVNMRYGAMGEGKYVHTCSCATHGMYPGAPCYTVTTSAMQ